MTKIKERNLKKKEESRNSMQNGLEREWIEKRQVSSPLDKQEIRDRIGDGRGVFILLLVLFFFSFCWFFMHSAKNLALKKFTFYWRKDGK